MVNFGRTVVDFKKICYTICTTQLWSLMTRRRLGAETSVTIMVFRTPRVYGTRMTRVYELYMHLYMYEL